MASWCLDYPTAQLVERLPLLTNALAEQPCSPELRSGAWSTTSPERPSTACSRPTSTLRLQPQPPSTSSAGCATATRVAAEALGRFKAAYRRSGFLVDTHGELPDYLPMVLEFAACADLAGGRELLQAYRPSLELLRIALQERQSHAGAPRRVRDTARRVSGEPGRRAGHGRRRRTTRRVVGLDPYDPRLLPLQPAGER